MLDAIRKGQRWLTAIFITAIGIVFVFFIGLGGPMTRRGPSGNSAVELDDLRLGKRDFLRLRARQEELYREQLGDQFDPRASRQMLDAAALGSLVRRAILTHEARELGLRVSRSEIQRLLRDSPSFRNESGKFDNEVFSRYVEWEYGSQRNYLEYMQEILLSEKLMTLLYTQGRVSEGELRASTLYDLQQVRFLYVALDTDALPADEDLSDQQIQDYLSSHAAEVQALYEKRREEYQLPAQARVRHILFAVEHDADEDQVKTTRERAEEALAQLRAGADFEALARELSDDPASRDQGGDLGIVSPAEIAEELSEVAFSLEPGTTSEVVRSEAGFHILRVDSRQPPRTKTLEEVEGELAREGAAARLARDRAEALSLKLAEAIRSGETLEAAAADEGLAVERTPLLRRRADGFVPGLGSAPEVLAAAFAMDEGQSSQRTYPAGHRLAMIQLVERQEPEPEMLESAMQARRARFQATKAEEVVQSWIERRRQELEQSGRLFIDTSLIAEG